MRGALKGLLATIQRATWLGSRDSLQRRTLAYNEWLQRSVREEGQDRVENLDKIETLICIIENLAKDNPRIEIEAKHVQQQIERVFDASGEARNLAKGTTMLSTIHQIKGQEADVVFIYRTDLMPHPYAKSGWERNQEDNLQYVAITRSKRALYHVESP
ncbi:unnamed protein product, partial [marine sediment metagenome]